MITRCCCTILLLWSTVAFAEDQAISIGTVSIRRESNKFTVTNAKKEYRFSPGDTNKQAFVMTLPLVSVYGHGGQVMRDKSNGLVDLPTGRSMSPADFPSFPFLDPQEKYIGFLLNSRDHDGQSVQQRIIFDTSSSAVYEIKSQDMSMPQWLFRDRILIGYVEQSMVSLNVQGVKWAYGPRVSGCYIFKNTGNVADTTRCRDLCAQKYVALDFSEEEIRLLKLKDPLRLPEPLRIKVLDKIYYGLKLGKKLEIKAFIESLGPSLKGKAKVLIEKVKPF